MTNDSKNIFHSSTGWRVLKSDSSLDRSEDSLEIATLLLRLTRASILGDAYQRSSLLITNNGSSDITLRFAVSAHTNGFNYFPFHTINKSPMFPSTSPEIRSLFRQYSTSNAHVNYYICSLPSLSLSLSFSLPRSITHNTKAHSSRYPPIQTTHWPWPPSNIQSKYESSNSLSWSSSPFHQHSPLSTSSTAVCTFHLFDNDSRIKHWSFSSAWSSSTSSSISPSPSGRSHHHHHYHISHSLLSLYLSSFFARGSLWPQSEVLCAIWHSLDYIFTGCTLWCKAIFTLERYLLVFHLHLLRSQRQKLLFHHIPLICINLYLILFYLLMQIILRCNRNIEFDRHLCGTNCIDQINALSIFNWLFNILLPVFIIILGSLLLLVRVLWKRREMQRNVRYWLKNRKMIVQLLGIALIYTLVWLPLTVFSLIETFGSSSGDVYRTVSEHLYFLTYLCAMTVPILALSLSPELQRPFRRCQRSGQVQDQSYTVGPISTYWHSIVTLSISHPVQHSQLLTLSISPNKRFSFVCKKRTRHVSHRLVRLAPPEQVHIHQSFSLSLSSPSIAGERWSRDREVIDTAHSSSSSSSSLSILADHHNQLLQQSIQAKSQQLAAKQVEIDEHQDRIQMIQQHHTIIHDELTTIQVWTGQRERKIWSFSSFPFQRLLFIRHTHQSNERSHLDLHRLHLNRLQTSTAHLEQQALQVTDRKRTFQVTLLDHRIFFSLSLYQWWLDGDRSTATTHLQHPPSDIHRQRSSADHHRSDEQTRWWSIDLDQILSRRSASHQCSIFHHSPHPILLSLSLSLSLPIDRNWSMNNNNIHFDPFNCSDCCTRKHWTRQHSNNNSTNSRTPFVAPSISVKRWSIDGDDFFNKCKTKIIASICKPWSVDLFFFFSMSSDDFRDPGTSATEQTKQNQSESTERTTTLLPTRTAQQSSSTKTSRFHSIEDHHTQQQTTDHPTTQSTTTDTSHISLFFFVFPISIPILRV